MENTNKIIQSLWIGGSLSVIEQLCIRSFLAQGHDFHLYTYGEVKNIPGGTLVRDANEIVPASAIFKDSRGRVATFADYFRYQLLFQKGGWWVDMDVFCLRYFEVADPYCFASETRPDGSVNIANCIFKAPQGAPVLKNGIEEIQMRLSILQKNKKYLKWHSDKGNSPVDKLRRFIARNWIPKDTEVAWGEFGPWFLDAQAKKFHLEKYIAAPQTFCPIPFFECYKLVTKPEGVIIPKESLSIHYWNEMFNLIDFRKDATYHPESIVETLKAQYL